MKQLLDIFNEYSFYLVLGFLLLVNVTIAGCHILLTLLLILVIIYYARGKKNGHFTSFKSAIPGLPGYFKFFLLYMILSFVSTLFAISKLKSFEANKEFFVFFVILAFLLIINTRKRLEYTFAAVLISAVLSSIVGWIEALRFGVTLNHRLKGLTSHWMTFSGLLMMTFIFFFVYLFYEKNKKRKIIIAISLACMLSSILLSLTRSVWVGIFAAVGLFIVYYKPKILYIAIPALVAVFFLLPDSVMNRMTSIFDMKNETNRDRFYMYQTGIKIFKQYPLFGVGSDNIEDIYDTYRPAEATLSNPHLHNNFMHILAERGILSLFALVAAFISIFVLLVGKIKNTTGIEKTVAVGSLFVFIGFLIAGLFEYNFGDTEIKFSLFYFLSIPFLKFKGEEEKVPQEQEQSTN